MTIDYRVLGLLPARGGSKGIPDKNLRYLHGKPLLAWSATALAQARQVDARICSTDDQRIAQVALAYGLDVPWLRPPELARDNTLVVDVIRHALESTSTNDSVSFTHVALVQATSPTVTATDIDAAINLAVENDADTVITGCNALQRHPSLMYVISEDGSIKWLLEQSERMVRRQDLPPVYARTGLVYVVKTDVILNYHSIYGDRVVSLIIPEERAITIDQEFDFGLAEYLLRNHAL